MLCGICMMEDKVSGAAVPAFWPVAMLLRFIGRAHQSIGVVRGCA